FEKEYIRKDGTRLPVSITCWQVEKRKGKPPKYCTFVRDISERKQAEEKIKESEERYRTMIENSNDWIWTLDTQGNFTFINHQAEIISGAKSNNHKGKSFAPFIHQDDLEIVNEAFQRTISGEQQHYTVRVYGKRGEMFFLSVNTAPIYERGKIVGTVSFGTDITEHIQLEEERSKAAKLESIGVLAGGIAHDFNNILTAILGNISLAKMSLEDSKKVLEILTEAEKASLNAKDLTHQLLTFSKGGEPAV
ncbi:unnamed protein product, partial [marine sediment metagenome]